MPSEQAGFHMGMTERTRHLVYAGLILIITLACYAGGFDNQFLSNWDDPLYVSANPDIQSLSLANLKKICTSFYVGNYAPLQMLSYMLDYQVWGNNPFGFILTNVLLHGLNGILFYLLLCRLGLQPGWALLASLLFAVHPVQVESVAWISQRKNVLAMAFFLGAFWHYLSYVRREQRRWGHYVVSILFFLLALLTKSVVVIFPALLLAYDFTLRARRGSLLAIATAKVPFALLTLGAAWLAMISQQESIVSTFHGGSPFATVFTMLTVFKEYLFNLFWPLQLSAFYQVGIKKVVDFEVLLSTLLLLASVATLLLFRRDLRRGALFWLALFFLGFLPVSQIIPIVTLMNDRYLYFPMLGICGYMALFVAQAETKSRTLSRLTAMCAVGLLLVLGFLSWQRVGTWKDATTLWQDATIKQPGAIKAWYGLALAYDKAGNQEMAIRFYQQALAVEPGHRESLYNLGLIYLVRGDFLLSQPLLEKLVSGGVKNNKDLLLLALNYYAVSNYSMAKTVYQRALANDPQNPELMNLIGLTTERLGDPAQGQSYWRQALAADGKAEKLLVERARIESLARRQPDALEYLLEAQRLSPGIVTKIQADEDFAFLHGNHRFQELLKEGD